MAARVTRVAVESGFQGGGSGSTNARVTRVAVESAFTGGGSGSTRARVTRVAVEVAVSVPHGSAGLWPDLW